MISQWYLCRNIESKLTLAMVWLLSLLIGSVTIISASSYWALDHQKNIGYFSQEAIAKIAMIEDTVLLARVHLRDYYIFTNSRHERKNSRKRPRLLKNTLEK